MNNQDTQTANTKTPTHIAFQIREGGQKDYWTRIGAAWEHQDSHGFNIQLDCLPLDGRICLRFTSEAK